MPLKASTILLSFQPSKQRVSSCSSHSNSLSVKPYKPRAVGWSFQLYAAGAVLQLWSVLLLYKKTCADNEQEPACTLDPCPSLSSEMCAEATVRLTGQEGWGLWGTEGGREGDLQRN